MNHFELRDGYIVLDIFCKKHNKVLECLIDKEDLDRLCSLGKTWSAYYSNNAKTYYAQVNMRVFGKHKTTEMQRFLMDVLLDKTVVIDHKNHNGLDNRRENLRWTNKSLNQLNRRGLPSHNTSGGLGVTWNKESKKWLARITINGNRIYLGRFVNKQEAIDTVNNYRNNILNY